MFALERVLGESQQDAIWVHERESMPAVSNHGCMRQGGTAYIE